MIVQQTLDQLRALRLDGMAATFEEQLALPSAQTLPFEDRFALLVEREAAHRSGKRLTTLLRKAKLKYATANLEDLDKRSSRGLDHRLITSLAHGEWLERTQAVLITGPAGVGKTWLACALAQRACRLGKTTLYARVPRLLEELRIARGDGTHKRRLIALAKLDLLVLDDWACTRWIRSPEKICSKSSTIAPTAAPPSSPGSSPSSTGTPGSPSRPLPMRSSIDCCITHIGSRSRASPCGADIPIQRPLRTPQRDRLR